MKASHSPDRLLLLLVVEDSPADVYLVQEALAREGLPVRLEIAGDGEQAIRLIEEMDAQAAGWRPDLILLDLNVPRLGGDMVLERVRRSPILAQTPVVVMTSSESPEDRDRLMRLGATEYFRKPSSLDGFMKLGPLIRNLRSNLVRAARPA